MNSVRKSFYYLFFFTDAVSIFLSFLFSDYLSRSRLPIEMAAKIDGISLAEIFSLLVFLFIWFFYSRSSSLYDEFRISQFGSQIFILLKNIFAQLIFGLAILFFLKSIILSRFFFVVYLVTLSVITILTRSFFRLVRFHLIKSGYLKKNIIIVGSGKAGGLYVDSLSKVSGEEYEIVGRVSDLADSSRDGVKSLGTISELSKVLKKRDADEIIISLSDSESLKMADILRILSGYPIRVRIIPYYSKFVSHKYQISFFNNIPVVDVINDPLDELHWRIIKRIFDIVFSVLIILSVFVWLFPVIALLIKLDSKGPVFFKQERWGKRNKKFILFKFRSMIKNSKDVDKNGKFVQATKNDSRITRVGRFLRKSSIDELPQFFNVLIGDMSVVGPRPHAVPQNMESKDKIENYMLRHLVKPGITGWAQVSGFRGETRTDEQMKRRVELDMFYIENWSFFLDLKIIFMTIWKGLKGDPVAY